MKKVWAFVKAKLWPVLRDLIIVALTASEAQNL